MFYDYSDANLANARSLRKEMTKEERHLWYDFLRNYPVKFYKQRRVGPYIADFYCSKAQLVVELDGGQHYEDEALKYDERRTKYLEEQAIHDMRFTNIDIQRRFDVVCQYIDDYVRRTLGMEE